MNSTLNIENTVPSAIVSALTDEQKMAKAKQVRTMGIIALVLLITGFIPILGFFGLIASMLIARKASWIAREYLVPESYEKPAKWAWTISSVLLILSVIGLVLMIL